VACAAKPGGNNRQGQRADRTVIGCCKQPSQFATVVATVVGIARCQTPSAHSAV